MSYYYLMQAIWQGGDTLTYGVNGCVINNPITTHMFTGQQLTTNGWTETQSGNFAGDRRMFESSGPFDLPANGGTAEIDFAIIFSQDTVTPYGPGIFTKNFNDVMKIKNWYANNSFPSCNTYRVFQPFNPATFEFSLYPNPSNNYFTLKFNQDILHYKIKMFDMKGALVKDEEFKGRPFYITALQKGIYVIELSIEDEIYHARLVRL